MKTKLKIISNRNLCLDLEEKIEYVLYKYSKGEILTKFEIDSLILREKDLDLDEYKYLFTKIKEVCDKYNVEIYAHMHWGLALELGIKKIHLPINSFINLCKSKKINEFYDIGVSIHSLEEAKFAEINGASYVTFSHVFETDCKKNIKPRGLEPLKNICQKISIPVYALGGIDEYNYYKTIKYGASGVCMMSNIMEII